MNLLLKLLVVVIVCMQFKTGFGARQQIGQYYFVEWDLDYTNSKITVELEAQTSGYVGFGFARVPDYPLMNEADIVIGGLNPDGTSYFSDRHGDRNNVPVIDQKQDYTFISAFQNGTHTKVKFSRPFQTADTDDVDLILGHQTVIWSFGGTDEIAYHGGINRGSFKLNWLMNN